MENRGRREGGRWHARRSVGKSLMMESDYLPFLPSLLALLPFFLPLPGARTFVSHVVAAAATAAADPALPLLPTVASGPNAVNRKKTNEKARSKSTVGDHLRNTETPSKLGPMLESPTRIVFLLFEK